MRVVSWNMGYNTNKSKQAEAWRYLIDELRPDIALVQEVVVPEEVLSSHSCLFTPPTRPAWGSAIVVAGMEATQLELPEESLLHRFQSRITVATVRIGGEPTLVASVHPSTTVYDEILEGVDRAAVATPDGEIWEADIYFAGLRELVPSGTRFIIGGDWMCTWLWDRIYRTESHGQFFERAAGEGWVEATSHFFRASEIDLRTWYGRRGGKSTPYQLDRIFLDPQLAELIRDCDADAYPAQRLELSDHAPLILDIEL